MGLIEFDPLTTSGEPIRIIFVAYNWALLLFTIAKFLPASREEKTGHHY
jgi:hypothetical protein